jgi:hypothetical protein
MDQTLNGSRTKLFLPDPLVGRQSAEVGTAEINNRKRQYEHGAPNEPAIEKSSTHDEIKPQLLRLALSRASYNPVSTPSGVLLWPRSTCMIAAMRKQPVALTMKVPQGNAEERQLERLMYPAAPP